MAISVEFEVASEILKAIDPQVVELMSSDLQDFRFRIRKRFGWKLTTVVFSRQALAHLATDPARPVKVEYLQKELVAALPHRKVFHYPRVVHEAAPVYSIATVR